MKNKENEPFLGFAKKLDFRWAWKKTSFGAAGYQLFHRLPALFAVAERPIVDVHAHELVGEVGVHLAGELHGVVQSLFPVFQTVRNAVTNCLGDTATQLRAQCAANGVPSQRQRQTGLLLPPDAKIDHLVQALGWEKKLSLMNEKSSFDEIVLNGVDDFVEGHHHGFKLRLVQFECEIGRGL